MLSVAGAVVAVYFAVVFHGVCAVRRTVRGARDGGGVGIAVAVRKWYTNVANPPRFAGFCVSNQRRHRYSADIWTKEANDAVDAFIAARESLRAILSRSNDGRAVDAEVVDYRGHRWGMRVASRRPENGLRLFVEADNGRWQEQFGMYANATEFGDVVFVHEYDQQCDMLNVLTAVLRDDEAVLP